MKELVKEWKRYRKTLVALLGAVLMGLNVLYANDPRVSAAIAVATALGVFQAPN